MIRLLWILVLIGVLISACSNTNNTDKTQSKDEDLQDVFTINQSIGRGINLGNALEAPNEGDWGVVLKAEYFTLIKNAGFNSVRIPIRWSAHAQADSPFTIDSNFLQRVDWAIQQAFNNQLVAIINIHHYNELFAQPQNHKQRFLAIWKQLSEHYQNYSQKLVFEILNEPHDQLTPELWNEYLADALEIIRQNNPNRAVIVGTANWGGVDALQKLKLPEDDYLILTFHYYNPFHFTHQGAEWVEGSDAWLGTRWLGSAEEIKAIQHDFDLVGQWATTHQIPVFMGEFGAYSKADMASRVRWTSTVARQAEQRGFSWAYWEFCSGFGVFDPVNNVWHSELLKALIPDK